MRQDLITPGTIILFPVNFPGLDMSICFARFEK